MSEENGAEEVEVVEAGAPEDIGADLAEMLDGLGQEATSMDCWRRAERPPRKWGFLENFNVVDFSLSVVAERHGGGDYQIRVKNPDGKYIKSTTRTFRVEGPPRDALRPAGDSEAKPDQFATLTTLLQDLAVEMRNRHAEPSQGENPMVMAIELSKTIREAASEAAQQVRDMMGPGETGAPDPFDLLERVMDLQERLGGEGGGGTDHTVNMLGRELLQVFKNHREGRGQPDRMGAPATAGPGSASTAPDRPGVAPPPDQPAWVGLLTPWMPQLTALAARGRDPGVYALVVQDQLSDRALDTLSFVVAGPTFAEEFYLYFPDTLAHRIWFDELLAALRQDLAGEEGHESDIEVSTETVQAAETPEGPGAPELVGK